MPNMNVTLDANDIIDSLRAARNVRADEFANMEAYATAQARQIAGLVATIQTQQQQISDLKAQIPAATPPDPPHNDNT